ncbi:MAG: glycosyltransferase [Armatimonadota bacterium]|nr:glycosyltransferase [Armatimonadota bacterium]
MAKPRVSVLMPVYNSASTVEAAVLSMLRQTMPDFELVVVDDGSTDETPEILRKLSRLDARIIVRRTAHLGLVSALNTGLEYCSGELVARMDADDISHRFRLAEQVEFLDTHPEISVCGSLVRIFPRKNLLGGMIRYEQWLNSLVNPEEIARDIFVESPVVHPSVMLRRSELVELGGYRDAHWVEDYDLWLRFHLSGKRIAKVPRTLLFWRHTADRVTMTDPRCSVEAFLRAKAHYLGIMLRSIGRPVVLWGAGQTGRRLLKHLMREGVAPEAVVDIDPKKIGGRLRGVPVVAPDWLVGKFVFVVAAVSSLGARELIRERLREMGFAESRDFLCAA